MKEIEKMIEELCPEGVEYKELGELLDYEQPTKYIVRSTEYDDRNEIPVLTAGQSFILGYTNEKDNIYRASKDKPTIIFDDFTTSFHWVDFDFKVKSSAMKMLRPRRDDINFRYIYQAMCCIYFVPQDHARYWISKYSKFEIPIPPIEIQEKIVAILDNFTSLISELESELEARKKQYEYYRNTLLNFTPPSLLNDVKKYNLGDVLRIMNGKDYKHLQKGQIPVYGTGGVMAFVDSYAYDKPSVLLPRKGSIEKIYYIDKPFWTVDTLYWTVINYEILIPKYLFYYLSRVNLSKYNVGTGAIPSLTQRILYKIAIEVPSLSEQHRIVNILDKFETLVNQELPNEIKARQQQYEYYRNKLLNFERRA